MGSVYSIGLSALDGYTSAMNTVGNNLANEQTTGFKSSDVAFSDLVGQMMQVGSPTTELGVTSPTSFMQFLQGGLQSSASPLDCAINGDAFFTTDTAAGQQLYTRDGSFQTGVNAAGNPFLESATGNAVEGYAAGANGTFSTSLSNIVLPTERAATATTAVTFTGNLNSATAPADQGVFPVTVYDSSGAAHQVSLTFTREASTGNWTLHTIVDGTESGTGTSLQFNSAGELVSPPPITMTVAGQSVSVALPGLTQFASPTSAAQIEQNGSAQQAVTGYTIGSTDGVVYANTADGGDMPVARLGLADIQNPATMQEVTGGDFELTSNTRAPVTGNSLTLDAQVVGQSTEASTTNIAQEFGNLIQYQRGYEMNSKAIMTADDMRQDLLNLVQ